MNTTNSDKEFLEEKRTHEEKQKREKLQNLMAKYGWFDEKFDSEGFIKEYWGISKPQEPIQENENKKVTDEFNTNSEIGSTHWFNTLTSRITRMGEFIENNPSHELVPAYGIKIKETSKYLIEQYEKLNHGK